MQPFGRVAARVHLDEAPHVLAIETPGDSRQVSGAARQPFDVRCMRALGLVCQRKLGGQFTRAWGAVVRRSEPLYSGGSWCTRPAINGRFSCSCRWG